jgi:hypothetical protein
VIIDLAAFVSFLPLEAWLPGRNLTLLTLLRLTRLLVLVRFARELASDIYTIVTRREQLQQFGLVSGAVLALSFVSAVLLSELRVPHPYAGAPEGGDTFLDQLWWTFRQLESADNLVQHVRVHPLVLLVSLGLTITGVFVVSYIIGIGSNVVDQVIRTERLRPVNYRAHSVIIGPVEESEVLVREFVRLYDKNRALHRQRIRKVWRWLLRGGPPPRGTLPRIALLGPKDAPPAYLYDSQMRWVVYRTGDGADPVALERVAAAGAKRAILLSHGHAGYDADAVTLGALAAFRAANRSAEVHVELRDSDSRGLAEALGGDSTIALDVPRFLGLFLCQHLVVPGVQALYHELLTADGSELYTHIFIEPDELSQLSRLQKQHASLPFSELARRAYHDHGVVLVGVFLGEGELSSSAGMVAGVDRLVQWINPSCWPPSDARIEALGGQPGEVPIAALRGLVGIADTYLPLRRFAHALAAGRGCMPRGRGPSEALAKAAAALELDPGAPRRVLVVGFSPALAWFLRGLAFFVPGVEVVLAIGARGDETLSLRRRIEQLDLGASHLDPLPGKDGRKLPLPAGGSVTLFSHDGPDLAAFAGSCLAGIPPVDAAVFLSEPSAADRDARTSMRLLRFARALEENTVPRGERLHVLAEFASSARGERLQSHLNSQRCGFEDQTCLRLTFVSTDQIKNYLMVHSAFVPGVAALYGELLTVTGQELVRLPLAGVATGERVSMAELADALQLRGIVPIALELAGKMVLNPPASERHPLDQVAAIYAIAERQRLEP